MKSTKKLLKPLLQSYLLLLLLTVSGYVSSLEAPDNGGGVGTNGNGAGILPPKKPPTSSETNSSLCDFIPSICGYTQLSKGD